MMYIVIDIGNTRTKLGFFDEDELKNVVVVSKNNILQSILPLLDKFKVRRGIFSSVGFMDMELVKVLRLHINLLVLTGRTKIPFKNMYESPKTLGVDRIALVAAALKEFPKQDVLIIDAGTCITYDFVSKDKSYYGGAISPGIRMRYRSLSDYTEKLPLLDTQGYNSFIGKNTCESIHSGVVNGICCEIDNMISQYMQKYKSLTVILTGGDANFLSKQLKSSIFAYENFLLEGLYKILTYNIKNDTKTS